MNIRCLLYQAALSAFGMGLLLTAPAARAQSVGIGTTTPEASAALHVQPAANNQGLLLPRLTSAQRAAIANPATGLEVYQTDGTPGFYYYNGVAWVGLPAGTTVDATGQTTVASYGQVTTLAGSGASGSVDGPGSQAQFNDPLSIALDATGNSYVYDNSQSSTPTVRKIAPNGVVSTLFNVPNVSSSLPPILAVSPDGNTCYITTGGSSILRVVGGSITYLATASLPTALAVGKDGTLYYATLISTAKVYKITTPATAPGPSTLVADIAAAAYVQSLAVDATGTIYAAGAGPVVRKISPGGAVATLAGSGTGGYQNGPGATAQFGAFNGLAVDKSGNVYVADNANHVLRLITPDGQVSSYTSNLSGFRDGYRLDAQFRFDAGAGVLAVDAQDNLYVADEGNYRIRRIGGPNQLLFPQVLPYDNLGNHTATQALNLNGNNLTNGNNLAAVSVTASAGLSAATLTASTSVSTATLTATTSITTPSVFSPTTGGHNMLAVAYGSIGSTNSTPYSTSGNFSFTHTAGSGVYVITFTSANLSGASLGNVPVLVSLYGGPAAPGLISWVGGTGTVTVYTYAAGGAAADRGFSFSVFLP